MLLWQGLRIRDVERRAADLLCLQRVQQGVGVDDGAAADVGDVRAAGVGGLEQLEFGRGEEVRCFFSVWGGVLVWYSVGIEDTDRVGWTDWFGDGDGEDMGSV